MSDTPSEEMQARMMPVNPVFVPYTPGQPLPDPASLFMVELSDGSTVPLSVFGNPPAELPSEEWDEWYANRDEDLVMENLK